MSLIKISVVQMSLMSAVLITVIIMIRAVTINRLPKKTFLVMWEIAGLSLCIPFQVSFHFGANTALVKTMKILKESVSYTAQNFSQGLQNAGNQNGGSQASYVVTEGAGRSISALQIIWVIGAAACIIFFAVSYVRSLRRFAESMPVRNQFTEKWIQNHKIRRRIEIRESGTVITPLTYGILHPVILMPKQMDWNNEEQVSYILEHEFVHIRRMDIAIKVILNVLLSIHWFNPMVWAMYLLCNRDMELSCDETVIRSFGIESKSEYAYVLIHMEESKSKLVPLCNYFSKNAIEERIKAIMKTKKNTKVKIISAGILVAGVLVFSVFSMSVNANTKHEGTALELPTTWEGTGDGEQSLSESFAHSLKFPEYEKYGLSYDEKSGYLMYDNKTVGYFRDEFKQNTFCRFVEDTGEIGVRVIRDGNWNITGMEAFPMSEIMNGDTVEINSSSSDYIESNSNSATVVNTGDVSGISVETVEANGSAQKVSSEAAEANGNALTTPNEEYVQAGIEWKNNTWYYQGKLVAAIYDHNGGIFTTDSTSPAGITDLEITRDKQGKINQVTEITEEQMQVLFHNNMSD